MSGGVTEDFRDSFFEECEELLEAMRDGLELLANGSSDEEVMHAIFRAVHSIKGGAGAFGLHELVGFAHHFETALDRVRSGQRDTDESLIDLFHQCGDNLSDLVAAARVEGDVPCDATSGLCERLCDEVGIKEEGEDSDPDFEPVALDLDFGPVRSVGYQIAFETDPDLFASGNDPVILFRGLKRLGELEVDVDAGNVPSLESLDVNDCLLVWALRLCTDACEAAVREVFEFVEGACKLSIEPLETNQADAAQPEGLAAALPGALPSLTDMISTAEKASKPDEDSASSDENPAPTKSSAKKTKDQPRPGGTIRVELDKIDKLINLVGELVIKEAMLSQSIAEFAPPTESDVASALESLKQLAGEIQEGVMAIRAQPVKPMFQRMARIAREAGAATEKRVRLMTNGEYTEVDKTVLERLIDPLTHMIRNAIDHGLESGDEREAAGKSREGTVTLSAAHRSGRVIIDVADDGGGINRDVVRKLAVARGLIQDTDVLSPSEIDGLLFLPGFSSKDEVSEMSGRGVGLDVVRSEIQKLGGRVSIYSDPGEGTTFSISLPLTLAVLEGMVIRVADQTMVVPISAIQETLQSKSSPIHTIGSRGRVLQNRNGLVPIIDLGEYFGFRTSPDDLAPHVLLLIESDNNQRFALIVDEIQDQRQVVIKSLETNYQQVRGVAAATILGDGRIALIIDPDNIARPLAGRGEQTQLIAV